MNIIEILDRALETPEGITLTFENEKVLHSHRLRLYKAIKDARKRNLKDYMQAVSEGVMGVIPASTGWDDLAIRKTGLKVWIGLATMENLGIVSIEKGKPI